VKRRRRGTVRLWGGVAGCALVAAGAGWSEWCGAWYVEDPVRPSSSFALDRSAVSLTWFYRGPPEGFFTGIPVMTAGWTVGNAIPREALPRRLLPRARMDNVVSTPFVSVVAPLWLPFAVSAAVAWWGWRARRRFPIWGCVGCGYDLRGGEPGKCPECGREGPPAVC